VITHTRQILYTTAPDQDHTMLLEVMALATDVAGDFKTVG
jgi:hypothetical protein